MIGAQQELGTECQLEAYYCYLAYFMTLKT